MYHGYHAYLSTVNHHGCSEFIQQSSDDFYGTFIPIPSTLKSW